MRFDVFLEQVVSEGGQGAGSQLLEFDYCVNAASESDQGDVEPFSGPATLRLKVNAKPFVAKAREESIGLEYLLDFGLSDACLVAGFADILEYFFEFERHRM